jgi:ATP-binding cassette, subfamily B, bacterial PglK
MLTTYRKLYDLLDRRERRRAVLVFGLMLVVATLEVVGVASIMPFMAVVSNPEVLRTNAYLAWAYDAFGFHTQEAFLFWLGLGVFALLIFSLAAKALSFWVQVRFSNMRNHSIGCRLMEGYLGQPYEWFLNRHTSEFATNVLQEVNQVVNGALFPAIQMFAHGLVAFFLLALLIAVDPALALSISIVLSLAYGLIFFSVRNYLTRIGIRRRDANYARFHVANEAFGGIKDVKLSGLEAAFMGRFRGPSAEMARRTASARAVAQLPSFAMQALVFGGMIVMVLYLMASKGGFQEALPVLALYAFAGYRLMPSLQEIYRQVSVLRFAQPALDALHSDMRNLSRSGVRESGGARSGLFKQLEIRGIRFTYPGAAKPALDGISLTIAAQSTVGLVGTTGSGKTTLVDVVLGLLPPECGELVVDGDTITPRNLRKWQRSIGYVPQQIYLTDNTVTANIAFGIPPSEVDQAAVERAAKIADIHDFVVQELPKGYETPVGERGVRLSGGQRQRIGIARALYHDPDILILDEATSALDNLTEHAVMQAVHQLGHRKTIVLIAHRLSTVRLCDQIHMLERGKLVASGSYDELVAGNPAFRAMAGHGTAR